MVTVKVVKTDFCKNFEIALKTLGNKVGKVGWFENSRYKDTETSKTMIEGQPVAQVAHWQEFGVASKNIPPRPFIRPTIANKSNEWKLIAFNKSKLVIEGKMSSDELMELIGQKAVGDISKTIKALWNPSLKPGTINARIRKYTSHPDLKESTRKKRKKEVQRFISSGFYKPLIDTGLMLSTLINKVENE